MRPCPACGGTSSKAIYAGFPVWLCDDMWCSTVHGRFSGIMDLVPFNGSFLVYEGSYLGALWLYVTSGGEWE